jgi:catechol 2,3-dioxygenase-like lactoylglutathione lyase family enzyme
MVGIAPAIRVSNMDEAVAFYRDLLGFEPAREINPEHNSLRRGDSGLMLEAVADFYSPSYNAAIRERLGKPGPTALYIEASDLDALHDRVTAAGVAILDPIADRDWGQREFTIADPAGNWLTFWRRL